MADNEAESALLREREMAAAAAADPTLTITVAVCTRVKANGRRGRGTRGMGEKVCPYHKPRCVASCAFLAAMSLWLWLAKRKVGGRCRCVLKSPFLIEDLSRHHIASSPPLPPPAGRAHRPRARHQPARARWCQRNSLHHHLCFAVWRASRSLRHCSSERFEKVPYREQPEHHTRWPQQGVSTARKTRQQPRPPEKKG